MTRRSEESQRAHQRRERKIQSMKVRWRYPCRRPDVFALGGERRNLNLRAVLHFRTNWLSEISSLIRRYSAQRSYANMRSKARQMLSVCKHGPRID